MAFDEVRYEQEVLEPARKAGGAPPDDLLVRYGLAGQKLGSDVSGHVAHVVRHWRALRQRPNYAALAATLLSAHEALECDGPLDGQRLLTLADQARSEARERLRRTAGTIAGATTCVSPAAVDALVGPPGGLVDRSAVVLLLRDAGVRIVDPVPIPEAPEKGRELSRLVRRLGLRLSAEMVFGSRLASGFTVVRGFCLSGPGYERLDASAINGALERLEPTAHNDRKVAAASLLTILRAIAGEPGALDRLVLWELAELLQRSPAVTLSQRVLADVATDLGLDRGEAEVLAMSVHEAGRPDLLAERLGQLDDALFEGRLRAAERLAAALPEQGEAAAARRRVAAAAREVARLDAEAAMAVAEGRAEEAASVLARAVRQAADDEDLRARLRAIAPPPPPSVEATAGEAGVIVRWRPSPALVGSPIYRLLRSPRRPAAGPADGVVVGDTTGVELADAAPPAGEPTCYTVFASRDRERWSAGASAGPTVVVPDVAELRVVADSAMVSGSWRARPDVAEVLVARSEDSPPQSPSEGTRVAAVSASGFSDPDVRIGVTVHYLVVAVYGASGERYQSYGLVASATPEPAPTPITDLAVTVLPGPGPLLVQACWTAPARGVGTLLLSPARPPWPLGSVLPVGELSVFGREAGGSVEKLPGGRRRLALPAGEIGSDRYLTAVTGGRSRSAVGATVELLMAEPVRDLAVERFGDEVVRLSWRWPADSPSAWVRWWRAGQPAVEIPWSRARYEAEGCEVSVGPAAAVVSVAAVSRHPSGELRSVAVEQSVEGLPARVRYAVTRRGWPRRCWALELVADTACDLPGLVLVRRQGTVLPLHADHGAVLARVPPRRLEPMAPAAVEFPPPPVGPARLRLFAESAAPPVMLIDPPVRQLVLT